MFITRMEAPEPKKGEINLVKEDRSQAKSPDKSKSTVWDGVLLCLNLSYPTYPCTKHLSFYQLVN
jgi:hypothetical protein